MRKNSNFLYSLFTIAALIAAPVLRLFSVFFINYPCAWVYVGLMILSVIAMALETFKTKRYAYPFEFKNQFHLDIFSYIASLGFFVSFVAQCIFFYNTIKAKELTFLIGFTIVMSAVCAVISCGYFIFIGLSFSGENYDFRNFKFVHVFPMFWALTNVFELYETATGFEKSIDTILMYASAIALVCFFYMFALEVDVNKDAMSFTVFFARVSAYLLLMFFFDRLILVLAGRASVFCTENAFSVSTLLMCGFIFFFEKNIFNNYLNKKTES